jgi:hypothetical protein
MTTPDIARHIGHARLANAYAEAKVRREGISRSTPGQSAFRQRMLFLSNILGDKSAPAKPL